MHRGTPFPKLEAERLHSIKRAKERYGLDLTGADLKRIVMMIQNSQSRLVSITSTNYSVHDVTYRDTEIRVVYDKRRKSICTALPREEA